MLWLGVDRKKVLCCLSGVLLLGLIAVGYGKGAADVLVYGQVADIITIDPAVVMDDPSYPLINATHDTLVTLKEEGMDLVPALATSWEVSDDGTTYTFYLRKGVKFHDGTEFDAYAVKFSWDRILLLDQGPAGQYSSFADLESTEVVDKYTFRIKLKHPYPAFLLTIVAPQYAITSPTYVKAHATSDDPYAMEWMARHECGTGPFKLVEWVEGQRVVLERFEDHWGEKPRLRRIVFRIVRDPTTLKMMLERGEVDIAIGLTRDQVGALQNKPGVKIKEVNSLKDVFIIMNCENKYLKDVRVRKAISYAINYQELIQYVEHGHAKQLHGTIPEGMWGYNPDLFQYHYDPDLAREFLVEAGYPQGFTLNLIYSEGRYAPFEEMVTYLQAYLQEIGISLNIEKLAWPIQIERMKRGEFDLALQTWTPDKPDPDEYIWFFYNTKACPNRWNWSFWRGWPINEVVDELTDEAKKMSDREERTKIYDRVQRIAIELAVYVYLYHLYEPIPLREEVHGFYWNPILKPTFRGVYKE